MAREIPVLDRTRIATASTAQYVGVILDASNPGNVVVPSAGNAIYGVTQEAAAAGASVPVRVYGLTKMTVGAGGVTVGDKIMVTAAGLAVTATTTNFVVGFAEDTAAAGAQCSVLLLPGGKI